MQNPPPTPSQTLPPTLPRSVARPISQVLAERRRIKTETSASGGWGARLQALFPDRGPKQPR